MPKIAASLMCANLLNLQKDIEDLDRAGVDMFHIDIMDGHFAPNLALSMDVVRQIKKLTRTPLDVHLMVDNPELYTSSAKEMKIEAVSFHLETANSPLRLIRIIKTGGSKVGIALNPTTGLENLQWLIDEIDFVLLMTVEPGFAGQKFETRVLDKILALRKLMDTRSIDLPIEVDGNINLETAGRCVKNGASILVAGTSSIFIPNEDLYSAYKNFKIEIAGVARASAPHREEKKVSEASPRTSKTK